MGDPSAFAVESTLVGDAETTWTKLAIAAAFSEYDDTSRLPSPTRLADGRLDPDLDLAPAKTPLR